MSYFLRTYSMNRLDRVMGILLLLRGGTVVSATDLARRFEVSPRTIYRDLEVLSGLGVPVIPEMGRRGGFRLGPGFFLPPIMLGSEEAVSLLLGLTLMRALRVVPFPEEADFAERKLLSVLPEETRKLMERASRMIGFEKTPPDLLHPEREDPSIHTPPEREDEPRVVNQFLRAILSRSRVRMRYRSPYRNGEDPPRDVEPRGLVWDRDRWYLVGDEEVREGEPRMWRSDRVVEVRPGPSLKPVTTDFDVRPLLGRRWLGKAMERWRAQTPVRVAMTPEQAEGLKRDWYYGHARFEDGGDGRVVMTWGEGTLDAVAPLLRWLGPGAELLEPRSWREDVARDLRAMLESYDRGSGAE